jgi:hypothetical protein
MDYNVINAIMLLHTNNGDDTSDRRREQLYPPRARISNLFYEDIVVGTW